LFKSLVEETMKARSETWRIQTWRSSGYGKASDDGGCSFCGKGDEDVRIFIAAPGGFICEACVILSDSFLRKETDHPCPGWRHLAPAAIKAALDERVIGQERAKRILSVALYNHRKRLANRAHHGTKIAKSNILLIGPSGTGKTLLARTLAEVAEVPFAIVDATTLTETGYVGADVESILQRLLQAADHDVALAEGGILYIDEIDKIARRSPSSSSAWSSGGRNVAAEGVQQALLQLLEGTRVTVPRDDDRRYGRGAVELDTTNILFICGGHFALSEGVAGADDLVAFGFIPELVGRLPVVVPLADLDEADLLEILTQPRNALVKQYELLFRLSGVELEFASAGLRTIARQAAARGMGARGLRAVIEQSLLDLMFELPDRPDIRRVLVDQETIELGSMRSLLGGAGVSGLTGTGPAPRFPGPQAAACLPGDPNTGKREVGSC
jgi:ATP-dependent Clp protease ATP-binding subunit ClpX